MGRMGFYFGGQLHWLPNLSDAWDKNALPVGMLFLIVVTVEAGPSQVILPHFRKAAITAKTHARVSNCSSGACAKNEQGLVTIDEEVCIGCRSCVMSCSLWPTPVCAEASVSRKCDGCSDLTAAGGNPVCRFLPDALLGGSAIWTICALFMAKRLVSRFRCCPPLARRTLRCL